MSLSKPARLAKALDDLNRRGLLSIDFYISIWSNYVDLSISRSNLTDEEFASLTAQFGPFAHEVDSSGANLVGRASLDGVETKLVISGALRPSETIDPTTLTDTEWVALRREAEEGTTLITAQRLTPTPGRAVGAEEE